MSNEYTQIDLDEAYRALAEFNNKVRIDAGRGGSNSNGAERIRDGVSVISKELVTKVLLDSGGNYSMGGHAPLAANCFGQFYLMLDQGVEYQRQAQRINAAIQSIPEKDAFDLALSETRRALAEADHADLVVVAKVATRLCTAWFDLPDGNFMKAEWAVRFDASPPPRCPSDFIWPSAFLFLPQPDDGINKRAPLFGHILREAAIGFVNDLRSSNQRPRGVLSRTIFDTFSSAENELAAQTIVGLMVGLLPPVIINIFNTLNAWKASPGTTFTALQAALRQHGGSDPHQRARDVLKTPMMQAMQNNPMPFAIWRTAVKEHTLGDVQVLPGDKISIQIINATQEDLHAGVADVLPVFGGDRSTPPHATHACPAYEAAFGIMLGTIFGMMEPA